MTHQQALVVRGGWDGHQPVAATELFVPSELAGFIAKFTNQMQDQIRGCRAKLRERFPHAVEMVYDNYNFLVMGFGPADRLIYSELAGLRPATVTAG